MPALYRQATRRGCLGSDEGAGGGSRTTFVQYSYALGHLHTETRGRKRLAGARSWWRRRPSSDDQGRCRARRDRVSIRSVLRGGDVRSPRKSRRRTKILVGWFVYCGIAVGGTAAAFTVRDTLFPQLGGPSKALWVSPTPEVPLTTEHGASSTEGDDTTPVAVQAAAVVAAETAGPALVR